jgi:hypothetical protein
MVDDKRLERMDCLVVVKKERQSEYVKEAGLLIQKGESCSRSFGQALCVGRAQENG